MSSAWEAAYDEAQRRDGPLDLDRSRAEAALRAHLTRRLAPLEIAPLESTLDDLLARSAGADLVLATAVEEGLPEAERRLRERLAEELGAVARKRGVVAGRIAPQVTAVIDAALAPPPHPHARTGLAAYDGSASLTTWLALALEERVLEDARQPGPGEPPPPPAPPVHAAEHPSANLLAGLAEGRLLEVEAQAVLGHVERCARCQGLLKGLALGGIRATPATAAGPDPSVGAPRPQRRAAPATPRRLLPLLAAVGLVVGIIVLASSLGGGPLLWREARGQDTEHEVHEAARRLASQEPGLFADFEPFLREELEGGRAPEGAEASSGPRAILPRERVLSTTPTFLWQPVAGAPGYTLTLRDEEGRVVWSGRAGASPQAWPEGLAALERGMPMTWEVVVEGAPEPGERTRFSAAPERDAIHWQRRVERLPQVLRDERVRAVFLAQLALRRGHVWEAWTAIRRHLERFPHDGYAAALEGYLQRVHGLR